MSQFFPTTIDNLIGLFKLLETSLMVFESAENIKKIMVNVVNIKDGMTILYYRKRHIAMRHLEV